MFFIVPMKQVNTPQLKAELIAAGVPSWPGVLSEPLYIGFKLMAVELPDESNQETVTAVVAAHIDARTPAQVRRAEAERELNASAVTKADHAIRLAIVRVLAKRDLQVRNWLNQLRTQLVQKGIISGLAALPTPTLAETQTDIRNELALILN